MPLETRLYLAVTSARKRMQQGQPAQQAAKAVGYLLDVSPERVHALASKAEAACAETRATLEHEARSRMGRSE